MGLRVLQGALGAGATLVVLILSGGVAEAQSRCAELGVTLGSEDANPGDVRVEPQTGEPLLELRSDGRIQFGFNGDAPIQQNPKATFAEYYGLHQLAGATLTRYPIHWGQVEAQQGQFVWTWHDTMYCEAVAEGISPILIVHGAPVWAVNNLLKCLIGPCPDPPHPTKLWAFERFVETVTQRYPDAAAIEIWNEPNLSSYWGGTPDPIVYSHGVLRSGYKGVKDVNPEMPVLGGALSNATTWQFGAEMQDYLGHMYANGAADHMDGLSVHAYPVWPAGDSRSEALRTLDRVDAVLAGYPDELEDRHIWITETGATTGPSVPGSNSFSEAEQASSLEAFYDGFDARGTVDAVVFHRLVSYDANHPFDQGWHGFGWVEQGSGVGFPPKQVFCEFGQQFGTLVGCPAAIDP